MELRDWLASFEVTLVGMEATGVYRKPVYYVLEDAEWICRLLEHGLLVRPSFVPPKEIGELRNLTR